MTTYRIVARTKLVVPVAYQIIADDQASALALLRQMTSVLGNDDREIVATLEDWDFDLDAGDIDVQHIALDGVEVDTID